MNPRNFDNTSNVKFLKSRPDQERNRFPDYSTLKILKTTLSALRPPWISTGLKLDSWSQVSGFLQK